MINFKSVEVINFLSFGQQPAKFDLSGQGTTLIIGNNEDVGDKGGSKNGVGKTTYFQAILFALFGKGIDKGLKTDEFINIKNGKKLSVELVFEKGGKEYKIIRKRKPNSLELYIDDESITLDTMKNTDDVISEILGMDYEVFMTTYFLTPHREAFMAMSGSNQRSMIESMLSLDVLVKRSESLKLIRKDLEVDLKLYQRDMENANRQNESIHESILRLQSKDEQFEVEKTNSIKENQSLLSELNSIDFDGINTQLSEKEKDSNKISELNEELKKFNEEISLYKNNIREYQHEIKEHDSINERYKFLMGKVSTYESEIQTKVFGLTEELSTYKQSNTYQEYIETLEEVMNILDELEKLHKSVESNQDMRLRQEHELEKVTKTLESLQSGICPMCKQTHIDKEEESKQKQTIDELNKVIEKLDKDNQSIMEEIETIEPEVVAVLEEMGVDVDSDMNKLIRQYQKDMNEVENINKEIERLNGEMENNPYLSELEELQATVTDLDKLTDLMIEKKARIEDLELRIEDITTSTHQVSLELTKLTNKSYNLLDEYGIEHISQIDGLIKEKENIEKEIETIQKKVSPYKDEIKETKKNLIDLNSLEESLYKIESDIKHIGYLIKLLTDNKSFIRKNIVDSYIPFVNKKIIEYTDRLGLIHICSINNDLSTDIEYMGKNVSYFNLSQGERLRLNLSVNLAFRDLITMLGKGSNLLMIDEYMDSAFDQSGLWRSFNLIKEKANTVLLISHREEFKEFVDTTMTITKRNGFSFVE